VEHNFENINILSLDGSFLPRELCYFNEFILNLHFVCNSWCIYGVLGSL